MPDADIAFSEAIQNSQNPAGHRWTHAVVREAGRATGWFDLTQASSDAKIRALRSTFRKHYDAVVNRVMAGGSVGAQALVEHDGQLNAAQLAERVSREAAQQQAEQAGMPHAMTADQGLRSLRAVLRGA